MSDAFKPLSRKDRPGDLRLSPEARRVVDTLNDVLQASIVLHDVQKDAHHHVARTRPRGYAGGIGISELPRSCRLEAQINNRWRLVVVSYRTMLPDAEELVKWAAEKLAVWLPVKTADDEPAVPPGGGSGGSGGSAELGIPISWARKARN
jgi:hypothetical protein